MSDGEGTTVAIEQIDRRFLGVPVTFRYFGVRLDDQALSCRRGEADLK